MILDGAGFYYNVRESFWELAVICKQKRFGKHKTETTILR